MWQQRRDQHKRDDQYEQRDDALVNGARHHRLPVVHTGLVIRMGICCPVEVAHKANRAGRRLAVCLIPNDGTVENAKRRVEDSQHQRHHCRATDTKQRRQRLHSHRIRESRADRTMRLCCATLHDCALYHEVPARSGFARQSEVSQIAGRRGKHWRYLYQTAGWGRQGQCLCLPLDDGSPVIPVAPDRRQSLPGAPASFYLAQTPPSAPASTPSSLQRLPVLRIPADGVPAHDALLHVRAVL